MKLIPAYQAEQEAKKALEERCSKLYFNLLSSIEKEIEHWKNEGYFHFTKSFKRQCNDIVNYKVEKMLKKLLVGYGYKVKIIYPLNNEILIVVSWQESYFTSLYKYFKQLLFKKKNNE